MITYKMLEAKGACESQASLFKELFPNGAPLSVEIAVSVADKFDWDWAANNLLTQDGKEAYEEAEAPLYKAYQEAVAPLYKSYKEAEAPLYKAYQEAVAPLWKAYKEAVAPLYKAYQEAVAPLWKAYKEAVAPLYKAYQEAVAPLFAEICIKETKGK